MIGEKTITKIKAMTADQIDTYAEKKCARCGELRNLSEFYKEKSCLDGLRVICKYCACEDRRKYVRENHDKVLESARKTYHKTKGHRKKRSDAYREREKIKCKEWRLSHADRVKELNRNYYEKNRDSLIKSSSEWQKKNPEKRKVTAQKSHKKAISTPKGKLSHNIARVIHMSLTKGSKAGRHWECLTGYTESQLKAHLEKHFLPGMSWKNYGEWHVDHKIPIAVFNFETPEDLDFKRCWSLKNLQPLWAKENTSKQDRIDKPFQPSLLI